MKRIVILGAMALTLSLAVPMTVQAEENGTDMVLACLLYTSPSPRDS